MAVEENRRFPAHVGRRDGVGCAAAEEEEEDEGLLCEVVLLTRRRDLRALSFPLLSTATTRGIGVTLVRGKGPRTTHTHTHTPRHHSGRCRCYRDS